MKFCEECGAQLEEGAVFCEECGTPVEEAPQEPIVVVQSQQIEPAVDQKPKRKPVNKSILVGIIIVVLLVAIGIFVAILFTKGSDESPKREHKFDESKEAEFSRETTEETEPAWETPEETNQEAGIEDQEVPQGGHEEPIEVNSANIREYCGEWKNTDYNYLYLDIRPRDGVIYLNFDVEYSSGMHISSVALPVEDMYKLNDNTYEWSYLDSWGNEGILTAEFTTSGLYITAEETYYNDGYSITVERTLFKLAEPYDWETDFYNDYEPSNPTYNEKVAYSDYSEYYDGSGGYCTLVVCEQYEANSYTYLILEVTGNGTLWIAQFQDLNEYLVGCAIEGMYSFYPGTTIDGYPYCIITDGTYYEIPDGVG